MAETELGADGLDAEEVGAASPPAKAAGPGLFAHSSAVTDVALTMPVFVLYHLGVMALPVRNAADLVTRELVVLSDYSRLQYAALTLGLGAAVALFLFAIGRREVLSAGNFGLLALEGVLYALAMRVAATAVVGELFLFWGRGIAERFSGLIMSLGAGFYEELAFRVVLFGLGLRLLRLLAKPASRLQRFTLASSWALICALSFSGWHHVGALGEDFDAQAFVFRTVCGLIFTLIYLARGFAPAVWTHVSYDVWVLVL